MDLLSGETGTRFVVAILAVGLALAAFAAILWFLRNRPVAPLLTRSSKERQKRLSVIDATMIDARRRAVLIRRDNVEHLILIGGPADIVIESGIAPLGSVARNVAPAEQAAPLPMARQHMADPTLFDDLPEQNRPQQRDNQPNPVQRRQANIAMPSEDNEYTYGPEAILAARDFAPEPSKFEQPTRSAPAAAPQYAQAPAPAPSLPVAEQAARSQTPPSYAELTRQAQAALLQKRKANAPAAAEIPAPSGLHPGLDINAENAEEIIAMLRSRLLGDDYEAPSRPSYAAVSPSHSPRPEPQQSAFSRVLDGNPEPGDLPPEQTPSVKPARAWSPPVMNRLNPTPAKPQAASAESRDNLRREQMLELEMARILEEMQMRRSK